MIFLGGKDSWRGSKVSSVHKSHDNIGYGEGKCLVKDLSVDMRKMRKCAVCHNMSSAVPVTETGHHSEEISANEQVCKFGYGAKY